MSKHVVNIMIFSLLVLVLTSCTGYNRILRSADHNYKYEMAKSLFVEGRYTAASSLLEESLVMYNGKANAGQAVFLLANCYYNMGDYVSAAHYFKNYYRSFPNEKQAEYAMFMAGMSLYLDTPDPRLDQSSTRTAIAEFQSFLDYFPYGEHATQASNLIYEMYDRLVEKEYRSAQLYYNLGNYMGNNYQSSIQVARNAIIEYPYTRYKEDLSILILKAQYKMAQESVVEKKLDRYRATIDEYYAFMNEYPDSKYKDEAERIFKNATKYVNN
ncbi:MAG: outer membrane protein assembly factor BamD [Bacteroidaceae bacterium]|nr:outer membrane protein assembly factor BamD [Bacteroidaceae bacterium]